MVLSELPPGADALAPGGCDVEVYRRLPAGEDLHIVSLLSSGRARILDLGAGAGRLANPLAALGHHVTAVDSSAEMLAHITSATTVRSRIEDLDLGPEFDVVVLASNLINAPDEQLRADLFASVARHLAPEGKALVQWLPPAFFAGLVPGAVRHGHLGTTFSTTMTCHALDGDVLSAELVYDDGARSWPHPFRARRLETRQLRREAEAAGLTLHPPTHPAVTWLLATPSPAL